MKHIATTIHTLAALALVATALTACDNDANKTPFEEDYMYYQDVTKISLYTPDLDIEKDPLCTSEGMLCTSEQEGTIVLYTAIEDQLQLFSRKYPEVPLALPFLDSDGNVRSIFKDGVFANLYNSLKAAADAGKMDRQRFLNFQQQIAVIRDTLTIGGLESSNFPYIELGASLISWDEEQRSNYVKVTLSDTEFQRRSNVFYALQGIKDILEQWAAEGKFTQQQIAELNAIADQQMGSISNAWGWMTMQYVNYSIDLNLHIEQADGLLDKLSTALYGKDSDRQLWLVISFNSNFIGANGYEEVNN